MLDSVEITTAGWYEWDVTAFAQQDFTPQNWRISLRLKATDETSTSVAINGKEYQGAMNSPELVLQYEYGEEVRQTTIQSPFFAPPRPCEMLLLLGGLHVVATVSRFSGFRAFVIS